jgi:hypothetical protein
MRSTNSLLISGGSVDSIRSGLSGALEQRKDLGSIDVPGQQRFDPSSFMPAGMGQDYRFKSPRAKEGGWWIAYNLTYHVVKNNYGLCKGLTVDAAAGRTRRPGCARSSGKPPVARQMIHRSRSVTCGARPNRRTREGA